MLRFLPTPPPDASISACVLLFLSSRASEGGLLHYPPAQKNQYWEAAWQTFHRSITAQPSAPISLLLRPLGTGLAGPALPTWGGKHSPLAAGKSAIKGKTWITSLLVWAISNLRAPDLWLVSCADSHTHTTDKMGGDTPERIVYDGTQPSHEHAHFLPFFSFFFAVDV